MRSLVILAGGQSRRMGRDKASLPVDGSTLLRHLVERLRSQADELIVAGGVDPGITRVRWVADRVRGAGPLGGMAAGLRVATAPAVWIVACDLPDVVPALGQLLLEAIDGHEAVVPRVEPRPEATCAVYRTELAERIEGLLQAGHRSVRSLLDCSDVRYLDAAELRTIDPDLRSFRNVNTPDEYARWLSER
jgi:molybdenum cofactor guanylyltransferase